MFLSITTKFHVFFIDKGSTDLLHEVMRSPPQYFLTPKCMLQRYTTDFKVHTASHCPEQLSFN